MAKFTSTNESKTLSFAKKFAQQIKGGEVLALLGDLGSGKTVFARGLAAGLGVKNIITSPTFVLMKVYPITANRQPPTDNKKNKSVSCNRSSVSKFIHIDAYRLKSGADLDVIGATDYFGDKNCVTLIEWADRVKDIWPKDCIRIKFKILAGDKREISIN